MSNDSAKHYQQIKNRLFLINIIWDLFLLNYFFFSGLSARLAEFATSTAQPTIIVNAIYIALFALGFHFLHFPLSYYSGFVLEHKFGLSNQKFKQWLMDDLKKGFLGLILFIIVIEALYWFLSVYPDTWWVGACIFWLFFTFVLAKLMPNVIIPLFYKYGDVNSKELVERIKALFNQCEVNLKNIYSIDFSSKSKKANAFLCGIGGNRRVVLSDTLLSDFSDDEIEVVVAHELGHYKHRDIMKLLCVNTISSLVGLYLVHLFLQWAVSNLGLTRINDIAFFPLIILGLTVFGLVSMPLINGFSRLIEREADQFSLQSTQNPEGFISAMEKLSASNLAVKNPGRLIEILLYDHPSIGRRIEFARMFTQNKVGK